MISILEYASAVDDRELMAFVNASYNWAKSKADGYGVSNLVGWFPESYFPNWPSCEGCTLADMIGNALKLTVAGVGDYWDDIV